MRLLFYPVTLILFAVSVTATPPPGHVHRPNDDKNPPNYQYKYEIGDADGKESQGKVETRSGELASGRYYVNDEQSSTDVKYFADEWGYHPLVKYRAADDHSAATAHFALGEHVVKALLNGTEVGEEVKFAGEKRKNNQHHRQQLHRRRRPIQVIQPYTPVISGQDGRASLSSSSSPSPIPAKSQPNDDSEPSSSGTVSPVNLLLNYDLQRTVSRGSEFHDASTTSSASSGSVSGFQENFNNYVTLPRISTNDRDHQRQSDVRGGHSSSSTPDYRTFSQANLYVTNPSSSESLRSAVRVDSREENHEIRQESSNDLFSTVSDDLLLVQNAGSFGRRLNPASLNSLSNSFVSTAQRVSTSRPISSTFGIGASSYASHSTTTPRTSISYPTESVEDRRLFSTTPIPDFQDVANSVSAETLSNEYRNSIHRDNSVSGAYAGIFAKIFPNSEAHGAKENPENANSLLTENSPLIRAESGDKNDSLTKADRVTTPGLSAYGKRRDHELYVTLRQSLDSEIRDLSRVYSSTPQTLSTFNSKPIVVAELLNYNSDKGFEYSTTFPCTDDSYEISTTPSSVSSESLIESASPILVTPKLRGSSSHITTSSVILNPIQAGVSLLNAGETELISSAEESNRSPAPVNEKIEDERVEDAIKNFSATRINELVKDEPDRTGGELYEMVNAAFGQTSGTIGDARNDGASANSQDQQIEIQKSVEIYQNAPVHEIHYPPQVISQVSGINHQSSQQQQQQQQQQQHQENSVGAVHQREEQSRSYVELQDVGNAKQFQQRYNNGQDQQHQSINGHISYENSRGGQGVESVYLGNLVRVDNELADYGTHEQSQVLSPGREDHVKIIKMIRDSIPEIKYTAAKTPSINVQVYPSSVPEENNSSKLIKTEENTATLREQQIEAAQAVAEKQAKKVQSQLHKILSESSGVQRYFTGAGWTRHQEQETHQQEQQNLEILQSQRNRGNHAEESFDNRAAQPQQQQSATLSYVPTHHLPEKNPQQNLGNVYQENTSNVHQAGTGSYLPPPAVVERVVHKTIHVPQPYPVEVPKIIEKKVPYPVEKIVERKVPYPVEKIVEKKVPVPQPYPVRVEVPVDRIIEKQVQVLQPYPVHIEKIIEKKVPYPVQRLVPQPYPVHIYQPYPVEKIVEKAVHIPVTVEKIVEKKVHVPHPYPVQVPIKVPYPVELTKYVEQTVQVPYGVRYGVSYQQIMKPQSSQGLYAHQESTSLPVYGVSLVSNHHRDRLNESQDFQGYSYGKPAIAFVTGHGDSGNPQRSNGWEQFAFGKSSGNHNHQVFAKKSYGGQASKLSSLTYGYSGLSRRQVSDRQNNVGGSDKAAGRNEYLGPAPAAQQQQQQKLSQSNSHQKSRSRSSSDQQKQLLLQPVQQHSTAVTRTSPVSTSATSSRRAARQQQENPPHYQSGPGAFRQSKIEYGFKPPMVPSIQYDENTATKVEN